MTEKIVCYYGSWAAYTFPIEEINAKLCTHFIYAFVILNEDGTVGIQNPDVALPGGLNGLNKWSNLKARNPLAKSMVAMGGWGDVPISKYSKVFSQVSLRAKFVENVIIFLKKYNFDGFDLDWEYPNNPDRGGVLADKVNFVEGLKLMRKRFDEEGLILSAALAAPEGAAERSYMIAEVSKYLHFINLMAYDFHGSWEGKTGINSPVYSKKDEANKKLNFVSL